MSKRQHITDEQAQQILDFAVAFGRLLGLPHHWIKISTKPAPSHAIAYIVQEQQRYLATIRVCKDWSDLSEFERFHAVVHEVCHMLHRRVETAVGTAEALMHDYEFGRLRNDFMIEIELMVDGLALAFCHMSEVRALWYGPGTPETTDPETDTVPAAAE